MKAILFDCDGTIADSFGTICVIVVEVFAEHGLEAPSRRSIEAIIGLSLEQAMQRLHPAIDEVAAAAMAGSYRRIFRERRRSGAIEETMFDGMRPLLESLSARPDVLLGMVTGKSRRGVDAVCAANGMTGWFAAVRTADDCPSKPHPAMVSECCAELGLDASDALVVGDSVYDMEMARAAGAAALGVGWGSFASAPLEAAGAFDVARTVEELAAAIERWLDASVGARSAAVR